jgi:hypothetical protein
MLLSLGTGMRQTFAVAVQNIAWDWSQVPIGAIAALSVSASQ